MKLTMENTLLCIQKGDAEIRLDDKERSDLLDMLLDGPYRQPFTMRLEGLGQIGICDCENGDRDIVLRSRNKRERAAILSVTPEAAAKLAESVLQP